MVERSRRYLYHIVTEVSARNMPMEIALLPMVESAYNPVALSTARAAGIWQFIPSTGKHYGLAQNFWFDSRRDVLAATDKALEYLSKLHDDFDDWQLALAGYNWGEGNVARAVAKNKSKGLPATYAALSMPAETANYLPKLQAVKNIVRDPEKYGLALADIPDTPFFTVVKTTKKIDTRRAAEIAELSLDEFLALNPQHNRPVIAGADEQSILLPIDNAEIFAAKLELTEQPLVSWQAYRLKPNETLPQVAGRYGMSVETLRAVNGIGHAFDRAGRSRAARACATALARGGGDAVAGRFHDGALGPHVLLRRAEGRHHAARRRALRRHRRGHQAVERAHAGARPGGDAAARDERRGAGRQGRRPIEAGDGDARSDGHALGEAGIHEADRHQGAATQARSQRRQVPARRISGRRRRDRRTRGRGAVRPTRSAKSSAALRFPRSKPRKARRS